MKKKMDATASSKKPKRTPKNAARSAHGQRIHNASCKPPTPVPTMSNDNNLNVRTRSTARREAAIMTATPIPSARAPTTSPQGNANSKKEIKETKKSVRFALDDDVNTTTTAKDKPTPSGDPIQPTTTPASTTTLTPQRPRPLSAPRLLEQLLARNPDFGAVHARLRAPSAAPRLMIRQIFSDARRGKFSEGTSIAKSSPNEDEQEAGEKQMQEMKKKLDKKEKGKLLRKLIARITHDTRDGQDELNNAGYFLQVPEEVERTRRGSDNADAGAAGDEGVEGVKPWLVEEVFKMLVILVSWNRQLAPREEGEDAGCVLSMRQVLSLVEDEIEAAAGIVHGAV